MQVDAYRLAAKTVLDAEICIVGAGPAGITLAREFIGRKTTVAIIESGGLNFDTRIQELNEGTVIGAEYAGLRQTRCRQVGGTAHMWNTGVGGGNGAKYVPLDPRDFAETPDAINTKWPLNYRDLEAYYPRAHTVCSLGPFEYDGAAWADDTHPLIALESARLSARVYQCGSGRLFTETYPQELATSGNICVCRHATLLHFRMSNDGRKVIEANCVSSTGTPFVARASCFVLAAGAIENARLLLLSRESTRDSDTWIGRCFMEHPRDYALTLHPRTPDLFRQATFFDVHTARGGTVVVGRIAVDGPTLQRLDLPNASITLLPRPKAAPARLSVARIAWHVRRLIKSKPYVGGYGWSRHANLADACDAFQLLINLEQRPNPENRLLLARTRDAFGSPRVDLFWRWSAREQENLQRLRMVIASALEDSGLGRVEINTGLRPDPNAHHHSGTTRMHADPRWGVTDADGRVHGTDNLFVTGSSIFCSAGFANPTLTIVAFALRLADHLKARL